MLQNNCLKRQTISAVLYLILNTSFRGCSSLLKRFKNALTYHFDFDQKSSPKVFLRIIIKIYLQIETKQITIYNGDLDISNLIKIQKET